MYHWQLYFNRLTVSINNQIVRSKSSSCINERNLSSPVEGDAGKVIVIGFVVVFAKICSPSTAVYAVIVAELIVTYPLFLFQD